MKLDDMIVENCLKAEEYLAPYACKSTEAIRFYKDSVSNRK